MTFHSGREFYKYMCAKMRPFKSNVRGEDYFCILTEIWMHAGMQKCRIFCILVKISIYAELRKCGIFCIFIKICIYAKKQKCRHENHTIFEPKTLHLLNFSVLCVNTEMQNFCHIIKFSKYA